MAKQLVCQKFVYKIHSTRLRTNRWDLSLPIQEARRNDEVIALADSQILRWLDELNGITDAEEKAREIKRLIRKARKEPNSVVNRRNIKSLYEQLDAIQFKPDYVCLIVDKEKDFRRACKGFKINGLTYHRLLGTNGGVKMNTVVFLSDRHGDEIRRRIENGRNPEKELVPAKLEAYKALTCSASIPVSMPKGIIVVPDCETTFTDDVVYVSDQEGGEPLIRPVGGATIALNESDGYGIMLPSLARLWGLEMGLSYIPSGVNTRFAWEKGMVFTFDFLEFAERVAGTYLIKDAWGVERDVREAELILTVSMVKLWDSYPSMEEYLRNCLENKYTFGITKVCPEQLENERALNYQFIQSYDLTDAEIDQLIQPTMDEIDEILHADYRKTILFLEGIGLNERNIDYVADDFGKALMIDERLMDDPYVQGRIYSLIKNRIDEAKVGVVNVHGNYSVVSGDPYSLCQNIFGLEVTGLLKADEIYNKYWVDQGSPEVVVFRAPMSTHENCLCKKVTTNDEIQHWYQYMTTCTVFNSWDNSANALNGMDSL